MTPETLHRLFDVVADAPGGVQRLRELILQLAVRGKLVPQDPNDEPASVLLDRIEEEKRRLYREGQIGKPRPADILAPDDQPYEIPATWVWTRLASVGEIVGGGTPKTNNPEYWADEGIPWITPADLNGLKGKYVSRGRRDISRTGLENSSAQLLPRGTVLFSSRAPIGYVAIAANPLATNQGFKSCVPIVPEMSEYIFRFLQAVAPEVERSAPGTTFKEVSGKLVGQIPIPVPPVAEQHRIVAKVDQLMALCDELEERQRRRAEKRVSLNRSALHHLATATDDADLARHWRRIRDHFDVLYEVPETVAELRHAILQLAVRGKLVPQDPNDEPASVLLERIKEEKRRLYNEGKIRKLERLPPVGPDEVPFEVPEGWVWARFGDIAINRDAERVPLSSEVRARRRGPYPYYGASGIIDYVDDFLFDKPLLLIGEDGANLLLRSTPVAFLAEGRYWVNNHAHVIDGINVDLLRYLALFVNATDLGPYVTGTAQPKLNQAKLNAIAVALPPEAELARIVAKVDRLMALCDELEERLSNSRALAESVAAAVVHELTAA